MTNCAVKKCRHASDKQNKNCKITFHVFPSNPIIAAHWIEKIRLSRGHVTWKPTKSTRICSIHFEEKDLYTTKRGLRRLRQNAIPTKHLNISCNSCKQEHQGASFDGMCKNVQLDINIRKIDDTKRDNSNPHLLVACKVEKPDISSDERSENNNQNDLLLIKVEEDNQQFDEKRGNVILNTPTSSFDEFTSDKAKLNSPTKSIRKHSENIADLEFLYGTPREEFLLKNLKKKTLLETKHKKMLKCLRQQNRRLKEKNKTLQLIIANLRKKKPVNSDIDRIIAETIDSEDEKSVDRLGPDYTNHIVVIK